MFVIGSRAMPKRERVYHKVGCMYAKRIKFDNLLKMSREQAEDRHFCECKYCAGMKGDIRTQAQQIHVWEKKHGMELSYQDKCDTLFIRTEIGFWKIFSAEDTGKYILYHRNAFRKDMTFTEAAHGAFHRQYDVKVTYSFGEIIEYVAAHDKAKVIIMDDYHKLPKHSKKQKKYYKQAERRAKERACRRVEDIFLKLELTNN